MEKKDEMLKTERNFLSDVLLKIRLTVKLMQDDRIDVFYKLIPAFCLAYLIFPIDLFIGPIDDAIILYFGMDLFINICPSDIVNEYMAIINGAKSEKKEEVIDVDFKDN